MDENFYANIKVLGKPPMKINKGADGLYNIEMMVNKNIIKKEGLDSEGVLYHISIYIWEK